MKVKSVCANGHVKEWYSGPFINKMPVGNLCVAAAAYFSGCSTAKVLNFMKAASVSTVSRNTYYRIQKHYLVPAINSVWMLSQAKLLEDRQNRPVKLAGDGRCCSPGHTAKYGSYSLMDAETGHILCMHLIQVCKSNIMKTCPCKDRYFSVVKIDNFNKQNSIFFLLLLKTLIVGTR